MQRKAREKVGWQGQRPVKKYVAHGGVVHELGLLHPRPDGVGLTCGGIPKL